MLAFGRAVVLRHVNLFHQSQLAAARKKTVVTSNDFDAMLNMLTSSGPVQALGAAEPKGVADGSVAPTPAVQKRVDSYFQRQDNQAIAKSTLSKKRKRGAIEPQQFHRC
jgi:hypothetical protein